MVKYVEKQNQAGKELCPGFIHAGILAPGYPFDGHEQFLRLGASIYTAHRLNLQHDPTADR